MENIELTKEIFDRISRKLKERNFNRWFRISCYADWNARVAVNADELSCYSKELYEQYVEEVESLNKDSWGDRFFSSIWNDAYKKGEQECGWSLYKIPVKPEYTRLREELFSIKGELQIAGYKVEGISFVEGYFWYDEAHAFHSIDAFCFDITNTELEKWRDAEYKATSDEAELECEMEREREMQYAEWQFNH